MLIDKYEFSKGKFIATMKVPLKHTLLEQVCSSLGVNSNCLVILELGGVAPKELRKEGKAGKAKLALLMEELASTAQDLADNGIVLDGIHYSLLQATSGAKSNASMLLSSDARLGEYFKLLMTHPSKSYEQLMMGYQLPLTPNKALVTAKLKVLIVDDEFDDYVVNGGSISQCVGANPDGSPKWEVISTWKDETIKHFDTRQSVAGVGDCHVKISRNMANYLAQKVVGFNATTGQPMTFLDSANQGCQFRLMVHDVPAMAKGTFVVSDNVPEGYHMVIPKSSFKLGYPNLPTTDGTYRITLGATMQAVDGKAAFGSQFTRSMSKSVFEARKPYIEEQMSKLNVAGSSIQQAAKFFKAEANQVVQWTEVDEETGEEVVVSRDDWFYKAMHSIATSEQLSWALKDPTIVQRILSSLAKRKMKLALGMGFEGRVRTALPDDTLPLHVISAIDAPKLRWHDGQWFNGKKPLPHNAVGMVESMGKQYIGMLVVRGKAPIMNHAEQCMAVLVHRADGIGSGSEFMSHQSASVCTMDFDGDRNSSLVWKDEDGYLEAINHFVKLQRYCPITPVVKEKSKVNQDWGTLTRLVYESAFEMGCSGITSMYCQATESGQVDEFKRWLPSIATLTGATQLYLDCQKYAPKNPKELKAIIDDAMQYYQAWQTDQRCKDLLSMPYIHRELKLLKVGFDGSRKIDVGVIAECIEYVNSLHQIPDLLADMAPMARLKGIWGEYTPADAQVAKELRESLRNLKGLSEEGDCKKIGAIFDYARSTTKDWTDAQFSAFWDLWYKHESLVVKNRKGDEYIPVGGTPWSIFCDRIIEAAPKLETRTERVLFKKKVQQANSIVEFLKGGASQEIVTIGEPVHFIEKNGTIQMRTVHSIDGRLIGYVPLTIEQGTYRVIASLVNDAKGSPYKSCFQIKIVGKL